MFLSKFMQLYPRSLRLFSNVFRDSRSFCTTINDEKETAKDVGQTENKAVEAEKKATVSDKETPKEEKIIEGDYSFETYTPYGPENHKEKWITFYFLTGEGVKYKLRGYVGWNLLHAIRWNKRTHLFEDLSWCRNGLNRCGYCHVKLTKDFYKTVYKMDELEYYHLRYQHDFFPGSLGCKIFLQKCHDGAVIRLPKVYFTDEDVKRFNHKMLYE